MPEGEDSTVKNVVVGVSASSGSPEALRFAVSEAKWRGVQLVAVQAWRAPRAPAAPGGRPPGVVLDTGAAFSRAAKELNAQVAAVLGAGEEVRCKLVRGAPGKVLLDESANACLLVVDAPRKWAASRSPLLAHRLVYNAQCPVLIMPPAQPGGSDSALIRGGKRLAANAAKAAATAGRPGLRF
jgi:nucleotide-binding universal stress UspA family protein